MDKRISINLGRNQWIILAKFLSKNIGKMGDIVPVILLLEELTKNGISVSEMK